MTAVSNITIDDEFDRTKKYTNKCNFDDDTLRRRDLEMRELKNLYPDMCVSHLELAWNFCNFTSKEEQDRIIASKEFEKKPTNKRNIGGVIKSAIKIQTKEEYEEELLQKEKLEIKE
jgi:hypothetical protein